jgi:hypothetical protein
MNALELQAEIKAKQAELQAELERIDEEARREKHIQDAHDYAIRKLNKRIQSQKDKNTWIRHHHNVCSNGNIIIKSSTARFSETAYNWNKDGKESFGDHTSEQEVLSLIYKTDIHEYPISVDDEGKMELPYHIATSFRKYKNIKTVIDKIEEYIQSTDRKKRYENQYEIAKQDALNHLKSIHPTAEIKLDTEWIRGYGSSPGYNKPVVRVYLDNGFVISMTIGTGGSDEDKTFNLSYYKIGLKQSVKNCDAFIKALTQITDLEESFK